MCSVALTSFDPANKGSCHKQSCCDLVMTWESLSCHRMHYPWPSPDPCSPEAGCSNGLEINNSGVAELPLCLCKPTLAAMVLPLGCALLQPAAFSRSQEALRGEPMCWTGGWLADRRETEGQQAIHPIAAIMRPDVTGCAQVCETWRELSA